MLYKFKIKLIIVIVVEVVLTQKELVKEKIILGIIAKSPQNIAIKI